MANEGGGKFRKQRQHYRKPYESQKTLFYRMTDAVRGIWSQSWVSRLLPSGNVADQALPPPSTTTTSSQLDESLPGPSCSSSSSSHLDQRQLRSSLNSTFQPSFKNAEREDVTFAQPFGSAPPRQTLPETSTQVVRQVRQQVAVDGLAEEARLGHQQGCLSTNGRDDSGSSSRRRKKLTETVATVTTAGDNQSEASEESVSTSGCSSLVPHVDKREYQKEVLQLNQSDLKKLAQELQRNVSPFQSNTGVRRAVPTQVKNHDGRVNQRGNPEDDSESGSARTSLWSEPMDVAGTSKPQPVAYGKKPKFQASLLGSTLWAEKSVLSDSASNSPNSTFYKGATTFGGASAYGKLKLHQNTPYSSSLAARRQIRVKSAKSATSDVDIMSATAKRILHSLEKMSTPVLDAKKIPNDSLRVNTNQILLPGYGKRPNKGPPSRILTSTPLVGPPVGKLLTPAPASTVKVQFATTEPVARVVEAEKVETKRTETAKTTYTEKTNKGTPATGGGGGKMRSVRSELHYSSHAAKGEEVDEPDLPNIPLPIKTLPTFNLLLPVQNTEKATKTDEKKAETDKTAKGFTFASPIALPAKTVTAVNAEKTSRTSQMEKSSHSKVTVATDKDIEVAASSSAVSLASQQTKAQNVVSAAQQAEYKFSLPLSVVTPPKPPTAAVSVTFKMPEPKVPTKKRTSYGDPDSSLETSPKSSSGDEKVFGGLQPAAELKMGSVMDILGKKPKKPEGGEKKTTENEKVPTGFGAQFRPQPGSWECQVCLVRNGPSSSKCQSCDEPKVKLQPENKPSTSTVNFGDKFKPLAGSWECPSCMLRNKPDVNRCAACEASKPQSQTVSSAPATQESSTVPASTAVFATPAPPITTYKLLEKMWECDTCLVRNNAESSQCIACESPKPGAPSTAISSANSTGTFKMNVKPPVTATAPSMFKFGFQAAPATTEPETAVTNAPSKTQPTPTLTNTSGLTFGAASAVTSTTDGLFKFGATSNVPVQSNTFTKPDAVIEGFKFGVVPKAAEKEDTKAVAVPKVAAVPENAGQDVASIPKSNPDVKFTVTFGSLGNQEPSQQGTTFGASAMKPAVPSMPISTGSIFGSSAPMTFKDVQGASAQSSSVMKPSGQFTFSAATTQSTPEVQKRTAMTTGSSIFTAADTKTTSSGTPSGGFRFAIGKKDEPVRGAGEDFAATAAKRPALAPQPSLPSFSAFSNTQVTNTGLTSTTASASTMGGFSFGAPPPVSSTAPTAIFGSMAPSATKNPSAAFTFGSSLATTQTHTPAPSFSSPSFGTLASAPVQPAQSTAPTPLFGQITSSGATSTFGSSATSPSFTFGSTSTPPGHNLFATGPVTGTVGANLPAFGSGSNVSALSFNSAAMATPTTGNPVPSFAAPASGLLPSYKTAVSNQNLAASGGAGFNFGASATPAPSFQFGAPQQQMQQQQPSGGYSFGTMQATQAQQSNMFAFGTSSSAAAPTTGFNFNPATPKAFNFSGTTEPPTFAANPNSATDANPRIRTIKRARRRTFK